MPPTALDSLYERFIDSNWSNIFDARNQADKVCNDMSAAIKTSTPRLLRDDTGLIVYGSLARGEYTTGSDIDWTLLIDGQADGDDVRIAHAIHDRLRDKGFIQPNQNGAFGNMVFSPELIHQIGGQEDTNHNTTQRILLLLESRSIGDDLVRTRVIRAILKRYLEEDTPFNYDKDNRRTPRFLLNDVVRFWRTMAVDFANKQRTRNGEGWALRNLKLRLSRKLIFTSGILMCYRLHAFPVEEDDIINFLKTDINKTPLEILAQSVIDLNISKAVIKGLFDSYDNFLKILNDETKRAHLKNLSYERAKTDETFKEVRDLSFRFQQSLTSIFFVENLELRTWIQEYGVF